MLVNGIKKGIVIDHIKAGNGIKIIDLLGLKNSKYTIAFIMNATSQKYGRKDIIKIDNEIDFDLTILGLIDPNATVNIIEEEKIVKKISLKLPEKIVNVLKCQNPRCVTSVEVNVPHVFHIFDEEKMEYRCEYCDDIVTTKKGLKGIK